MNLRAATDSMELLPPLPAQPPDSILVEPRFRNFRVYWGPKPQTPKTAQVMGSGSRKKTLQACQNSKPLELLVPSVAPKTPKALAV